MAQDQSAGQVTGDRQAALIAAATRARDHAYAPYSRYLVGAAILTDDGRIFSGVNVENASFGLTVCAERTAVFTAVSEGAQLVRAVAVCTENGVAPCGACRQVLSEFTEGDIPIWIVDGTGSVRATTLDTLLPDCFGPHHLK